MDTQNGTGNDERIAGIARRYPPEPRFALAILQDIQHEFNHIPHEALAVVHSHIGTPEAQLFAIATFYKALSLKPKGRHIIKLCDGTACHMRGSSTLVRGIEGMIGIGPDETTPDGEFSLELVNCVGSCALAPVMVVDGIYHSKVTMEQLPGIIDSYRDGGGCDG
jgi:NADH-quinone oxidoreductase subunit E